MEKLSEKEWKPFTVLELFDKLTPGKGKGLNHLNRSETGINYIGATNRQNGVLCVVKDDESSHDLIQSGNCIGFIKNGDGAAGYAIYKQEPFVSTSDVIYGYAKWLNRNTGLFFVPAQDMIEEKYSHGYKRNAKHLGGDRVMLPVTDSGKPDYDYMEEYAKRIREKKIEKYRAYVEKRIAEIGEEIEIPKLSEKEWKPFTVEKLFDRIISTKGKTTSQLQSGDDVPYIAAAKNNNGFAGMYSSKEHPEWISQGNAIVFVQLGDGAAGLAYYEPSDFIGMRGKTSCGYSKYLDEYVGLFLAKCLSVNKEIFSHGHSWAGPRLRRTKVMLPVTDSGKPDYEYMEQYAKNMMLRKYKQYLAYLDKER